MVGGLNGNAWLGWCAAGRLALRAAQPGPESPVSLTGVSYHRGGGDVAVIELSRADQKNSIAPDTIENISKAFDLAVADENVRSIVLAGQGRHFCTGASPELMASLRDASPLEVRNNVYGTAQALVRRIYHCPKPTIAAVSGAAITLGCEFAIACDFRIVDESAYFQEAWIRLGLLPPLGGMFLLPRMVGIACASEMILEGRKVEADEALHIGLANRLVAKAELRSQACEWATQLAALPPRAYQFAKEGLHRAFESTMEKEWAANLMAQAILMSSEDFAEGVASVVERRVPRYGGR